MSNIKNIALAIPIHPPYFKFGVNLVYSSMGAEYDLVFVHSTLADRQEFEKLFPEPALKFFDSVVLDSYFNESQMDIIVKKRIHPTVKKFFALDCLKKNYLYVICMDAEVILLKRTGWNEAAQRISDRKCWFGGRLNSNMLGEQRIVHCSMTELPPAGSIPQGYLENIENFLYTWWWDLPVYNAKHVDEFLKWIKWGEIDSFLDRISWFTFDHVVYQLFTCIFKGYEYRKIVDHCHSLEFSASNVVESMNQNVARVHWVNGLAYAQNPKYYQNYEFLAVYNIDRTVHPKFI